MADTKTRDQVHNLYLLWSLAQDFHVQACDRAHDLAKAKAEACPGQDISVLSRTIAQLEHAAKVATEEAIDETTKFIKQKENHE